MTTPNDSRLRDWAPPRRNLMIGSLVAASELPALPSTTTAADARREPAGRPLKHGSSQCEYDHDKGRDRNLL